MLINEWGKIWIQHTIFCILIQHTIYTLLYVYNVPFHILDYVMGYEIVLNCCQLYFEILVTVILGFYDDDWYWIVAFMFDL